jgi:serine/threonine-protein kinase
MIHHNLVEAPGFIDQVKERVEQLRNLSHPNVAGIFGLVETGNTYALHMELAGKVSLDDLMFPGIGEGDRELHRWTPARALEVVHQVALGLAFLHGEGLRHGELAPGKIIFTPEGSAKLIGANICAPVLVPADMLNESQANQQPDEFSAPEVHRGASADALSDQFALGAIAWVLLMAKKLDPHTGAREITYKESGVPAAVAEVVAKMIQPGPQDRYADMAECVEALEALRS